MSSLARLSRLIRQGTASAGSSRGGLLRHFGLEGFAGVWMSASAGSLARVVTQLALSWFTLELTGSPLLVGAVLAARMAPQLVLGIPAGVIADWFERRTMIVAVNGASAAAALGVAAAAAVGVLSLGWILVAAFALGTLDALRTTVTQARAYDLVRTSGATQGIALTNLGAQLFSAVGGAVGGYSLERLGVAATFVVVAVASLAAAVCPALAPGSHRAGVGLTPQARPRFGEAATLLARNPLVAILALAIILTEILGYSSASLLPTFARDVFGVGASGLGAMMAVRAIGGVVALLLLAGLGTGDRSGAIFLSACAALGFAHMAFAATGSYAVALASLAVAGGLAGAIDTLGQTLLQRNSDDRARGAAMGVWVFSVGFGPFGLLALGAAADVVGVQRAQAISGATLVLVAAGLAASSAPLRRAR